MVESRVHVAFNQFSLKNHFFSISLKSEWTDFWKTGLNFIKCFAQAMLNTFRGPNTQKWIKLIHYYWAPKTFNTWKRQLSTVALCSNWKCFLLFFPPSKREKRDKTFKWIIKSVLPFRSDRRRPPEKAVNRKVAFQAQVVVRRRDAEQIQ